MPRQPSAVFLAALLASVPNVAHAQTRPIWGPPLPKQPFEKERFRPIVPPAWVEDTLGCGYTLSGMNGEGRAKAAAHGVTLSEVNFVDPFYPYYDSKLLKRRSPHVPMGRIEKDIAEYKKLGVRVLAVYPPSLQGEVYELHPEWRRISTDTREIPQVDLKKFPHGGMLCLLGPYGDFMIEVLAEIATRYPEVAAFSFDGLHYGGSCYCQHCREDFRREQSAEIPKADMNSPAFRRYQHWADRRMESMVQRMQTRLKAIRPELALVSWTTNAGRFGHFLSIPRNMPSRMNLLLDVPDQEFWLDETNRGNSIVPAFANAYIWATTNHRVAFSEPYLMSHGNPYGRDSFPPHEIERRMLLALTHGAVPSIAVGQPKHLQEAVYQCMDEVNKRREWVVRKRPEPWAALLMSDNTRNFYGRSSGEVEDRYLASVFGTFRMAMEEHLPVAVVNDWNLTAEDLAPYKVLILPNAACLDEGQCEAVEKFVRAGGGLVASLDASLCDEFGDARKRFALEDLLGVRFNGSAKADAAKDPLDVNFALGIGPDYWKKRKGVYRYRQDPESFLHSERMKSYVGNEPVTFKGPANAVVPAKDAQSIGWIRDASGPDANEWPAVVVRKHGKGKVVYLAAGFDAAYYLYSYPYQRLVLKSAVEWAAASPAPVTLKAPMCVQMNVTRQTKGGKDRLVIHLFNNVNTTGNHALPADDVPLREETIPIHDIQVRLGPYRPTRIRLEPEGIDLKIERTAEGTSATVPRLRVHSMVVCDLE